MSLPPSLAAATAAETAAAPATGPRRRWWRRLRTLVRWSSVVVLSAWSLALVAWLTLHWGILPRLEQWRPQIEARASAALGVQVRIGAIRVHSGGWVPAFEFADVQLLDRQGRVALGLARLTAALSPASLLTLSPRFAQLHVEGAQLDVRRDAQGRLFVAGFDIEAGSEPVDPQALDWVFEQQEIVVRRGVLRWTDEQRAAPPLLLQEVDLVLRNGLRRHDLRIDATPPPEWGERFSLRGRFTQALLARSGDFARWSGTLFADFPRVDVAALGRHATLPLAVDAGDGALRGWLDIEQGRPRQATLDLALHTLALRLPAATGAADAARRYLAPLALSDLRGRLQATRDERGVALHALELGFSTGDGVRWPVGRTALAWQQRQDLSQDDTTRYPVTGGDFSAEQIDLAALAQVARRLPLPTGLLDALQSLAPRGVLRELGMQWTGEPSAPSRWRARGQAGALALAAAPAPADDDPRPLPRRPGFEQADIHFDATERGGQARLEITQGALDFPGVFAEPRLPLNSLTADLVWRVGAATASATATAGAPAALDLEVRNARFNSAGLRGEASARWRSGAAAGFARGGRFPGQLELAGKLQEADAQRVARHLPLQLGRDVQRWVERAVQGGRLRDTVFHVKGDLWDFPFADVEPGSFRVESQVDGVTLAYVPSAPAAGLAPAWTSPWPAFSAVSGQLEFDRGAMRLRDVRGQFGAFELRGVQGGIADLTRPLLLIEGQGRGPAAELLRFVSASPVGEMIGGGLAQTSAAGSAELRLALSLPLNELAGSTVRGSVTLAGGDLRIAPDLPLLAQARGRVDFTQRGFALAGASARVAGGELVFDGGSQPDGSLKFSGQGSASLDGLRREPALAGALAPLAPVAARVRGSSPYRLQLAVQRGRSEWTLNSPLSGMQIDLPPPLAKPADAVWPLLVQSQPQASTDGRGEDRIDAVRIELGNPAGSVAQARLLVEQRASAPAKVRAAVGVGTETPPVPTTGVHLALQLPRLDADAWQAAVAAAPEVATVRAGAAAPPALAVPDRVPDRVQLRVAELVAGGRRLSGVVLDATHQIGAGGEGLWRARVDADQMAGDIELRSPREGPGRVRARLARLALPALDPGAVEDPLARAPASVPALDIVIEDFEMRGRKFGRVEVEAINLAAAAGQGSGDWQLTRLAMITPEAQLRANGRWAAAGGRRMALEFRLELADSGNFAERLGAGRVLRGGKGHVAGELSWRGSPLAPDLPSLDGRLDVDLAAGQLLNAEPGAARLLGLLSLQTLPRRLVLDFRDLFQEGFAFDSVSGRLDVERGFAQTNNLRLRGASAAVLLEGRFDVQRETQDLRVLVVPEINAGTASLAYAAINPAIGLGTLLAQLVLRGPLALAGTREFHVTGPWGDPKIERVERVERPDRSPR